MNLYAITDRGACERVVLVLARDSFEALDEIDGAHPELKFRFDNTFTRRLVRGVDAESGVVRSWPLEAGGAVRYPTANKGKRSKAARERRAAKQQKAPA